MFKNTYLYVDLEGLGIVALAVSEAWDTGRAEDVATVSFF